MYLVKYVNHFTNHTVSAEQEAYDVWKWIEDKKNPLRTLEIFEALEKRVELEMRLEEQKASAVCRAVNKKWQKQPGYLKMIVNDPVFEKPIGS